MSSSTGQPRKIRLQRRGEVSRPGAVLIVSVGGTIYSGNRDEQQVATAQTGDLITVLICGVPRIGRCVAACFSLRSGVNPPSLGLRLQAHSIGVAVPIRLRRSIHSAGGVRFHSTEPVSDQGVRHVRPGVFYAFPEITAAIMALGNAVRWWQSLPFN